ncbi:F-box domain-containing protein [Heracleum sosnowskyi]|uniref:F-box domain-containing protein n=1 Tax=Heracleum sosnowskyi TaxID=360622 RepID=A0AAD8MIH3_9APIA|nr:F-box domain-containing protein [Heracleum sosnowskyi]
MSHRRRSFVDLPEDLQSNVFLRLPVKCLLICKCVCKYFRTIIQNPDFTKAHLTCPRPITTETSRSLILGLIDKSKIPHIQCHDHLLSIDSAGEIFSSSPISPPIPYVGVLFLVGSCSGLICFDVRISLLTSESNFLLWNPVTRQTRYLPRLKNRSKCVCRITEFGFVRETNEYMVVNVIRSNVSCNIEIELYKMSTNSWTVYCNTTIGKLITPVGPRFGLDQEASSLFSNGCFHWLTRYSVGAYIVSFNLKNEELGLIKAVHHGRESYFSHWKLAVIEEALAMIYWKYNDRCEIWVLTDYRVEGSWVLKFNSSYDFILHPVGYWKYDLMIISMENEYCLLDLNAGDGERIPNMGSLVLRKFCSFEESFAPVRRLL